MNTELVSKLQSLLDQRKALDTQIATIGTQLRIQLDTLLGDEAKVSSIPASALPKKMRGMGRRRWTPERRKKMEAYWAKRRKSHPSS